MRGLPDSAVYGTYKRMSHTRRVQSEVNALASLYDTFVSVSGFVSRIRARGEYLKARQEFYAKHGYYIDDSTRR
jgi:hypothetical protein